MDENLGHAIIEHSICTVSLASLIAILDPKRDLQAVLDDIVQEVQRIGSCDHVFLSRYDAQDKSFTPISWKSTVNPGHVALEQKFMAERYLANRPVVLNDLLQYNYRLRPDMARLALQSMAGIPLMGRDTLLGAIECFSYEQDHFTENLVENLLFLAKQASVIIEKEKQQKICERLSIENQFMHEVQKTETFSDGMLLYRLGEALFSLLNVDGIAVFGLETPAGSDLLQDVMAKGFSMKDIGILKKIINKNSLEHLMRPLSPETGPVFIRQPLDDKLLYIVSVNWQQQLQGIIVYYWDKLTPDIDSVSMEQLVRRMLSYIAVTLRKNSIYNNIQRISFQDTLTQLANRWLFDYVLQREFNKVKSTNTPLSLLVIDIDHFKVINDQYGHQMGDAILGYLAKVLKQEFRNNDLAARYGGEEFAVILPAMEMENALAVADQLRQRIEETRFTAGAEKIKLTVSIGVATHNGLRGGAFTDPPAVLRAAEEALYKAKQQGCNQVVAAKF